MHVGQGEVNSRLLWPAAGLSVFRLVVLKKEESSFDETMRPSEQYEQNITHDLVLHVHHRNVWTFQSGIFLFFLFIPLHLIYMSFIKAKYIRNSFPGGTSENIVSVLGVGVA